MTTSTAAEREVAQSDLNQLVHDDGALTARQIARGLGAPLDVAWEAIRLAVDAGYLYGDYGDESGRYAPWCPWPQFGL